MQMLSLKSDLNDLKYDPIGNPPDQIGIVTINRVNLVNHVLICLIYFEPHTRPQQAGYIGHIGRTHRENPKHEQQLKKNLILIVPTLVARKYPQIH